MSTPKIEQCPRCGNNILIGDRRCSNCGLNLVSLEDSIRAQSPMFIAFVCLAIGGAFTIAATGMDGILQVFFLLLGTAIVLGGGIFMGISLVYGERRRYRK